MAYSLPNLLGSMSYEMTDVSDMRSVRTDGDSWDITESVGSTALGVAACRAIETGRDDPLIRDEFAHLLVSAAGPEWARMADGSVDWQHDDDYGRREFESAVDYQAVRTHFFDEHFAASARAGIGQVVILAAGLDSRAFRLEWPAGTVIFEIDQPKVLSYKTLTLAGHAVGPRAALPSGRGRPARRLGCGAHRRGLRPASATPPGWPRGCCRTCRLTRRTGCSTSSPN